MKSLSIGRHTIDVPVFLAPMSGVSDKPYRSVVKQFGAGLTVSEMVASTEAILHSENTAKRILGTHGENICDVQIVGSDPKLMARAAKWCVDKGVDIIDINFGCPAKKVTGKACGSAIMQHPDMAKEILRAVVGAVDVPVTMKMRTGWSDDDRNAPEIAIIAEGEGVQMLTIHGRTREQLYRGKSDWSFVKSVKKAVNIPILVNGDIVCCDTAKLALQQSGADGIMIGRGANGKPWLLAQVMANLTDGTVLDTPSIESQYRIVTKHYGEMLEYYGEHKGIRHARKHLGWYIDNFSATNSQSTPLQNTILKMTSLEYASSLRKTIMGMTNKDDVLDALERFYSEKSVNNDANKNDVAKKRHEIMGKENNYA